MCPRCQGAGFYPTGAFWVCDACGLAITEQALRAEAVIGGVTASERMGATGARRTWRPDGQASGARHRQAERSGEGRDPAARRE